MNKSALLLLCCCPSLVCARVCGHYCCIPPSVGVNLWQPIANWKSAHASPSLVGVISHTTTAVLLRQDFEDPTGNPTASHSLVRCAGWTARLVSGRSYNSCCSYAKDRGRFSLGCRHQSWMAYLQHRPDGESARHEVTVSPVCAKHAIVYLLLLITHRLRPDCCHAVSYRATNGFWLVYCIRNMDSNF